MNACGTGTSIPFEYVCGDGVAARPFTERLQALGFKGVKSTAYESKKKKGFGGSRLRIDPHRVKRLRVELYKNARDPDTALAAIPAGGSPVTLSRQAFQ